MQPDIRTITCQVPRLTHANVTEMATSVAGARAVSTVVVDLSAVGEADTAAFAALILLRRALLSRGVDLLLRGIRDRLAAFYMLTRMSEVLPQVTA